MGSCRNNVPSYLRHKASGQGFVRIGGKWFYLRRHGSPEGKAKYARLIAEHFGNGSETILVEPGADISIAALVVKYDDYAQSYYRKNVDTTSQLDRIRAAVRPLVELYAELPVSEFSPHKLKAVREKLIVDGSRRIGKDGRRLKTRLGRGCINTLISCIKRMFKWGVAEELVPVDVYTSMNTLENIKLGRDSRVTEPAKIAPVPEEYISAVLELANPQIRSMIELQLLTGMRPDEVTIIRPCDISEFDILWKFTWA